MRRKLFLETFGCQMNVLDSELVMGQLRAMGFEQVNERDQADVILYNTCSVREHAEQKVWSRLGELRPAKQARPELVIGVIGCMAEREGRDIFRRYPQIDILCGPAELDKLPAMVWNAVATGGGGAGAGNSKEATKRRSNEGIRSTGEAFVPQQSGAGTGKMPVLQDRELAISTQPSALSAQDSGLSTQNSTPSTQHSALPTQTTQSSRRPRQVALMGSVTRRSSTLAAAEDSLERLDLSRSISPADDFSQAYVRITRGCNKFCSYCVVPYTRGPEVHRPPQNIIDEVRKLVDAGAKEVTLLGQTVNHYHYRHDDGRTTSFADLLYRVHEATPDLPRLRFVTSFPRDFTDEALQAMRDCERICRYLHVPAQSGSDRILRAMNRGYTAGTYRDFIDRARAMMPDISLASDFIVGFPTETERDHRASLDLLRYCNFKNSFIFKYSPRPGTIAIDRFTDDVPEETKRRRNNEMLGVQQAVSAELNRKMIGQCVEVIVEGESKLVSRQNKAMTDLTINGAPAQTSVITQLVARTRTDQVVCFDGEPSLKGKIVDLKIIDAQAMTLFGQLAPLSSATGSIPPAAE